MMSKVFNVAMVLLFLSFCLPGHSQTDVDRLIQQLRDEDRDVRLTAVMVLGMIRDPRAVEPLIAALGDKDWRVRAGAAKALRKIRDPRAVEPLIAALGEITGKDFGKDPVKWQEWWDRNKETFLR